MDKKITRRVVLGTLLGGLAAGPFIVKALRKKWGDDLPSLGDHGREFSIRPSDVRVRFFAEWKNLHQSMPVPQPEILDATSISFPQKRNFSKPFKRNFQYMETLLIGNGESDREITANDLMSYCILEGELFVGDAGANVITILTRKNETKHLNIDVAKSMANGVGIVEKKEGGNATVIKVEIDLNEGNVDEEKAEIATGIEEDVVVQMGETGTLSLDDNLLLTSEFAQKVLTSPNLVNLYGKLYSLLYVPLPHTEAQVGSTVDFPLEAFLRQQVPRISYYIENAVSLNGFIAATVKPNLAQDEKLFREKVMNSASKLYREENGGMPGEIDEKTFLDLVEKRTSLLCNDLRKRFASNVPRTEESCIVVDTETGLAVCRKELYAQNYFKLGNSFVTRSFQVF